MKVNELGHSGNSILLGHDTEGKHLRGVLGTGFAQYQVENTGTHHINSKRAAARATFFHSSGSDRCLDK
jgi:hypothetical protein